MWLFLLRFHTSVLTHSAASCTTDMQILPSFLESNTGESTNKLAHKIIISANLDILVSYKSVLRMRSRFLLLVFYRDVWVRSYQSLTSR